MKTTLIATLLAAAAVTGVEAQPPATDNFHAPATQPTHRPRPAPPVTQRTTVDGVIPRAIRGGNALQMLNPRAPRRYGTSQEAVSYDQDDPYKWRGIKLLEIRF